MTSRICFTYKTEVSDSSPILPKLRNKNFTMHMHILFMTIHLREAFQKKNCKIYDIMQMGGQVANSKHDFFPKRNYDKRVGARIISQIIKTMNNSLFIEKHYSKPTVITFTIIFLHMSSEHFCFVCLFLMNLNFIEYKVPVYLLFH